jgi:hypothetical protein
MSIRLEGNMQTEKENGRLKRTMKTRHLIMLSLASCCLMTSLPMVDILLPGKTVQPLIKVTDTNNGINFILDFIIDYLSLWQSNYPVQFN